METWRSVLLIATVVGFLITAYGLVAAYFAAKSEREIARERIKTMKRLAAKEKEVEVATREGRTAEMATKLNRQHDAMYKAEGLVRPTHGNMVYLAAYEAERLVGRVLTETKRDFLIAGVGLVISTAASAASLYMI